ncbi:MAG TPA: DUF4402 domain-containing protein, partial [Sphingomicrobium sp.]|nr:DUF4402 domain-containing protein [Sphingomicrobium sp.]
MGFSKYAIAAALAVTGIGGTAHAAVPATTDSEGRALILVPLQLTKIQDLDFGSVIPSAVSGVVSINATTGLRTFAGGVTGASSDVGNRARFAGAGSANQQVIVFIDPPTELTSSGGDAVTVLGLTLDGPATRTIDPVSRAFFVGVGG